MSPAVSVVVPVHNERDNVVPLIKEIASALDGRASYEMVFVDDYSDDGTLDSLQAAKSEFEALRILSHPVNCGQSSAIRSGVLAARAPLIVTLDGDGQNDPADIPKLLDLYSQVKDDIRLGMVGGRRVKRQDSQIKMVASQLANRIRRSLLRDQAQDVGCGLKLLPKEVFLRLPYFDHMHRFISALVLREGYEVRFVDVNHRPRLHGKSNYGVFDRLWVSISDLFGVMWLKSRGRIPDKTMEL